MQAAAQGSKGGARLARFNFTYPSTRSAAGFCQHHLHDLLVLAVKLQLPAQRFHKC